MWLHRRGRFKSADGKQIYCNSDKSIPIINKNKTTTMMIVMLNKMINVIQNCCFSLLGWMLGRAHVCKSHSQRLGRKQPKLDCVGICVNVLMKMCLPAMWKTETQGPPQNPDETAAPINRLHMNDVYMCSSTSNYHILKPKRKSVTARGRPLVLPVQWVDEFRSYRPIEAESKVLGTTRFLWKFFWRTRSHAKHVNQFKKNNPGHIASRVSSYSCSSG